MLKLRDVITAIALGVGLAVVLNSTSCVIPEPEVDIARFSALARPEIGLRCPRPQNVEPIRCRP